MLMTFSFNMAVRM